MRRHNIPCPCCNGSGEYFDDDINILKVKKCTACRGSKIFPLSKFFDGRAPKVLYNDEETEIVRRNTPTEALRLLLIEGYNRTIGSIKLKRSNLRAAGELLCIMGV